MKRNLLSIVQSCLNVLDSDEVNSISDTVEAQQVAEIVRDVYFNIIAPRYISEHKQLVKLTALSDSNFPTHFTYPENAQRLEKLWYDKSDDDSFEYSEVTWLSNEDFLSMVDGVNSDYDLVDDKNAGTKLRIVNNHYPQYYTSFDDEHVVFNSYKSTVDSTLQASKVRAMGYVYPTFTISDTFVPDLDASLFPMFENEAKSTCLSLLKTVIDPKLEQFARLNRYRIWDKKPHSGGSNGWNNYGRN